MIQQLLTQYEENFVGEEELSFLDGSLYLFHFNSKLGISIIHKKNIQSGTPYEVCILRKAGDDWHVFPENGAVKYGYKEDVNPEELPVIFEAIERLAQDKATA